MMVAHGSLHACRDLNEGDVVVLGGDDDASSRAEVADAGRTSVVDDDDGDGSAAFDTNMVQVRVADEPVGQFVVACAGDMDDLLQRPRPGCARRGSARPGRSHRFISLGPKDPRNVKTSDGTMKTSDDVVALRRSCEHLTLQHADPCVPERGAYASACGRCACATSARCWSYLECSSSSHDKNDNSQRQSKWSSGND